MLPSNRKLTPLFVAATALFAPVGWLLFVLWRCLTGFLTIKPWLWVWWPLFILAAIQAASGAWPVSLVLVAQAGFALLAGMSLRADRRSITVGLILALMVFVGAGKLEPMLAAHRWQLAPEYSPGNVDYNWLTRATELTSEQAPLQAKRQWKLPEGINDVLLSFEALYETDQPDEDWFRSNSGFQLYRYIEGGQTFMRVLSPPGRYHHLAKIYYSDLPLAGRTFRYEIELRSSEPIERRGCRGLQLEVEQHFSCTPVALSPTWQHYALQWTVPEDVASSTLRLLLIDFDAFTFDVRNPRLYEATAKGWQPLAPLQPAGVTLRMTSSGTGTAPLLTLTPNPSWKPYQLHLNLTGMPDSELSLHIGVPSGQTVQLRHVTLYDLKTHTPLPAHVSRQRVALWFEHANLAGHTIAVTAILFAYSARGLSLQLVGVLLALAALYMTGSRAALFGGALGLLWALWLVQPRQRSRLLICTALMLLAALWAALISPEVLGRINPLLLLSGEGVNPISRWDIWQISWEALRTDPLTGLGVQSFASFMAIHDFPTYLIATHAHNFWLQFGAAYGIPGLLAALWLTAGLLVIAWRWGRWRGLGLVVPVLIMQTFDYTLFYPGVLAPLLLGLNTLREKA